MRYNGGMAEKRKKAGRPPKNNPDDVKAIQKKIDDYFDSLESRDADIPDRPPTFSGLALSLGYCSRQQLWEHGKSNEPISLPLKKAMLRIESYAETKAYGKNPAGPIFVLKNRGWTDRAVEEESKDNTIKIIVERNGHGTKDR